MEAWHKQEDEAYNAVLIDQSIPSRAQRRQVAPDPVSTFIPPPKTDITPELIQQALSAQPQNTAALTSLVPYFYDGVMRAYLQLAGPVAYTLVVNVSTSFPCGTIGLADPQPNVALVPLVVNQGQGQPKTSLADCECIAANMYQPHIITYWIQKLTNGNIYSVVGNNLVRDIDKMNTTQSTALTLTVLSTAANKRSIEDDIEYVKMDKRQIWRVNCNYACPLYHMTKIKSTDGQCACLMKGADENFVARDLVQPDFMNAQMSEEACAAMTCFNDGGEPTPALFNPFHQTCWCVKQPYIESNPSAWTPSS
jgi:hypothetical protein